MNISVIGLGKLGLPLAATIASKDMSVIGVDINKDVVERLNHGQTNLKEPGLLQLIKKSKEKLKATSNLKEAILASDISFVITPTPSKANGFFSLQFVEAVMEKIAEALKEKEKYHLVVLVSTVMPGATDRMLKLLEKRSGKKVRYDFGLCYNPEFIALGSVIKNLLNPDFVLIGESDKKAGDLLKKFHKIYLDNKPNIVRMNFVNAELTKISLNTFITTKISYANMLAEICEKLPGGNVDVVTTALGMDSRVGPKYLKGGSAFGGPCFPRDNIAFISLAKKLKSSYHIPHSTHKTNIKQLERLTQKVLKLTQKGTAVGILGIAYKPFTDVIDESQGLYMAKALKGKKHLINIHDPMAIENVKSALGTEGIKYFDNLRDCINNSRVLIIATNWPDYFEIKKEWLDSKIVLDMWRIFNKKNLPKNTIYLPVGLQI